MTDADRQRLAAILGMLGSDHAGERAAAGLQAEAFRRKRGLTWEKMLQPVVLNIPAWPPEPSAPPPTPRAPEPPIWVPEPSSWAVWEKASYVAIMASPLIIAALAKLFY